MSTYFTEAAAKINNEIIDHLGEISSAAAETMDIGDLGNLIGIALFEELDSEENIESFIAGVRHGISLKDGTHGE